MSAEVEIGSVAQLEGARAIEWAGVKRNGTPILSATDRAALATCGLLVSTREQMAQGFKGAGLSPRGKHLVGMFLRQTRGIAGKLTLKGARA